MFSRESDRSGTSYFAVLAVTSGRNIRKADR